MSLFLLLRCFFIDYILLTLNILQLLQKSLPVSANVIRCRGKFSRRRKSFSSLTVCRRGKDSVFI